jgi:hypothetical protein
MICINFFARSVTEERKKRQISQRHCNKEKYGGAGLPLLANMVEPHWSQSLPLTAMKLLHILQNMTI